MLRISDDEVDIQHWRGLSANLQPGKVADRYLTEEDCEEVLFQTIWKLGYRCPKCDFEGDIWIIKTRRKYECPNCRHQYTGRSVSRMYGKRASLLGCFKGAEFIIETMAGNKPHIQTINRFAELVGLSYRPARTLRLEMFEELKKPMGGFWGSLLCNEDFDEYLYNGDRLEDLLNYYDFEDPKDNSLKFGK
ncbi:transposase [Tateyamaria omphalii]|uniref:Transposase zinc-ribbon domain-containing protein n=1 Tax=Tateyamaria omphalii TaxID=299262 RepID=A0A1P8MWG9_9RHOB|nr:transposase [Tateyamaria omphalii]APX12425.1 hypothetical protein BWR18_12615 [Tateyamaria omphalii]